MTSSPSTAKKILKYVLSGLIGAVLGLVEAEIIANTLVEVSEARAFSIMFGVAFILLGATTQK